jgi:CheY-like chemotaxis protein
MREYDLSNLRVLVVDDNRHFVAIMRAMLRAFGVREIFDCGDAVHALELLRHAEIDLTLVDLKLGETSGLELTRLVRSAPDSQNPRMPVILVTAFSERSNIEAAIGAGVDEVLVKPLSPKLLFQRIVSLIENPRPYLRTDQYFGPDRRRHVTEDLEGGDRRNQVEVIDDTAPAGQPAAGGTAA